MKDALISGHTSISALITIDGNCMTEMYSREKQGKGLEHQSKKQSW